MRIGVDLQTVGRGRTGDETYYRSLMSHYGALRPDHDFYLYYTNPKAEAFFEGLGGKIHPRKLAFRSPFLRVPLAYPWQMRKEPIDVFHSQYVGFATGATKLVLTIHDLSWSRSCIRNMFPRNRALFLKLTRWCARRADAVVVVSEHTKKDLMRLYRLSEAKIHVVHNAAHPRYTPCQDQERLSEIKHRFGIGRDYILSVGSLQPRKNIGRLVKAYFQARAEKILDLQLVIVGAQAWGDPQWEQETHHSPYKSDIIFTGYVQEDDLPVLYSGASMFVYPSLYEGFGLPVLEAMACGTPVITSNVSSLPEVCGDAAVYVDPNDVNAISRAMGMLFLDPGKQRVFRERGLQRSALFSWERAARKTLAVYEAAHQSSPIPSKEWCFGENPQ